ncbi:hypothetical protein HK101_007841 [Irineochytrium annulatum]|nr:hypothetical protein HK101_007841 [Irineochytrium annulatum]
MYPHPTTHPFWIVCADHGRVLDVEGASHHNEACVLMYDRKHAHEAANQLWILIETSPGVGFLKNLNSGRVLDVRGGIRAGHGICQYDFNGQPNQCFDLRSVIQNGRGAIRCQGLSLDIRDQNRRNGAELCVWHDEHHQWNQQWRIEFSPAHGPQRQQQPVGPPPYMRGVGGSPPMHHHHHQPQRVVVVEPERDFVFIEQGAMDATRAAAARLEGNAHKTPVLTSKTLSSMSVDADGIARNLLFKCENLQKIGAFKFRGAFNAISSIPEADRHLGVVCHSSGNHAQAVALAAKMHGMKAHVVMPTIAPASKRKAVEGYGAKVYECGDTVKSREEVAEAVRKETGATFVHPYNNPKVMAGQGTTMLEFVRQAADLLAPLDAVIIPASGGGLLSGCCVAAKHLNPSLRIFAAEPQVADDLHRSIHSDATGARVRMTSHPNGPPRSMADGLLAVTGELPWPIIRDNVEGVFVVTEAQIAQAMKLVWERMKVIVEPSGCVGVAVALFSEEFKQVKGIKNLGVVFSGGNLDVLKPLPWTLPEFAKY